MSTRGQTTLREWAVIGLFSCLTVIMLYPLSVNLNSMAPEPTDPLLNAWRMQWNARAFLSGPTAIAQLFNTNIFYPFPLTLAYSEHFLMIAAQALPFLLLPSSHLFGMNLSVLITFILSGYGMYLLISDWTGNRWAGLVAGILFAFSPHRFGQLNHLELLVTQWMPLALLTLHWTLTRPGRRYPALFIIFFNLQALSGFHYALNLTIACALLAVVYALARCVRWRPGLWLAGGVSILVTLLLNWPIWRMYLRFSQVMGAVRTPGEVRIYSAAFTDYLTAIPYNFLYGWTFGRWQPDGHQFQPLMPVGLVGILLAIIALLSLIPISRYALRTTQHATRNTQYAINSAKSINIFLLLLTLLALLLSFGLNENALGPALAPILKYSPYAWLYDNIAAFQGIRVPGRYGILVVLGLTALAGWGVHQLSIINYQLLITKFKIQNSKLIILVLTLILLESWSAPLVGPEFPAGQNIPPVYHWLQQETSPDDVVLELPFQGSSEFLYEYYSSYHWRRLANGGTGFTPPIYKEMRQWFNAFPDPRSVDVIRQLGIDWVILHPDSYSPEAWQQLQNDLPRYFPAIESIHQFGDALVIRIAKSGCQPDPTIVNVELTPTQLDGLPNAVSITYRNPRPAAFVANARQPSQLTFADGAVRDFTEPLVTPAGEGQSIIIPLSDAQQIDLISSARLSTLNRVVSMGESQFQTAPTLADQPQWQSLGLKYDGGAELAAYYLNPQAPTACSVLTIALQWAGGQPGDSVLVQLLDPFGRVVATNQSHPWDVDTAQPDVHSMPLVGVLPAGRYGIRVLVRSVDGAERMPITDDGVTIPTNQIPPLPVVIRPAPSQLPADAAAANPTQFGEAITLLGHQIFQQQLSAGDWLRFSLVWQIDQPVDADLTVFTQLIGPDGQVWGQRDNKPGGGWYEVSLWPAQHPIVDAYAFQIQPETPPGEYRLIAGLYQTDSLARLPTQTSADFVEIGAVEINNE